MMWQIHRIESGLGSKLVHHIESPAHWLAMVGKRIQPLLSRIAGSMNEVALEEYHIILPDGS